MENDKIIDWILNEWAMRSPDGLVGGHDTPENIKVLNEILSERKLKSEDDLYLFKVEDVDGKVKHLISIGHPDPKYKDLEIYKGPHQLPPEKYRVANDTNINDALAASEKDPNNLVVILMFI